MHSTRPRVLRYVSTHRVQMSLDKKNSALSLVSSYEYPIYARARGTDYELYLSGPVDEPEKYTEWFNLMRNAQPDDTILIRINSRGGYTATAVQFARVMSECPAEIVCSIEGDCMSAATMIFLAGDKFEITPFSSFMVHNYSGGSEGKGGEMYDQIVFEREWSSRFLNSVYKDFLTKKEIESLLDGKDIWLHYDDVANRVIKREQKRSK